MPKAPTHESDSLDDLKAHALELQTDIAGYDTQIDAKTKERTALKNKLRSVTSKIVTIQLKPPR